MKHNMVRTLALLLASVMLISLFAGCGSKSPASKDQDVKQETNTSTSEAIVQEAAPAPTAAEDPSAYAKGGKLVGGITTNPTEFFTPYKQGTMTSYGWAVYEPLAWNKGDGNWHNCLAESWVVDNDSHTLTVKLHDNIKFSNGDPLTADDVIFTLTCRQEYGTYGLIGSPASVEKVDDLTVKITWDEFSLNYELWILPQYIYSKETFEEKGLDWMLTNMIGTGPYVLDEYIPDVHLLFSRNENYWREGPSLDSIEWVKIADNTALLAAFLQGEIDLMTNVQDYLTYTQLTGAGFVPQEPVIGEGMQNLALPITLDPDDPLANKDVRKAIYNGIDWNELAHVCGTPNDYHSDVIGITKMPYYKETLEQSKFDVASAKKALADAGYPNGFSTTLYGTTMSEKALIYMQDALKQLGITAEVMTIDYTVLNGEYLTGKAATSGIILNGWKFYQTNQTDRFVKFLSPVGALKGMTTYTDKLVELWNAVPNANSLEEQNALLYAFVNEYVNEEALVWPMYNTSLYAFYQPWCHFTDMAPSASAGYDPFEIWVEQH